MGTDGKRLREARIGAGLQQAQVAEATGLSRQYYNDVEHGRRTAPDDTYARLCAAVGLASDRPAARLAAAEAEIARLHAIEAAAWEVVCYHFGAADHLLLGLRNALTTIERLA